jgi:hypothetical protein
VALLVGLVLLRVVEDLALKGVLQVATLARVEAEIKISAVGLPAPHVVGRSEDEIWRDQRPTSPDGLSRVCFVFGEDNSDKLMQLLRLHLLRDLQQIGRAPVDDPLVTILRIGVLFGVEAGLGSHDYN